MLRGRQVLRVKCDQFRPAGKRVIGSREHRTVPNGSDVGSACLQHTIHKAAVGAERLLLLGAVGLAHALERELDDVALAGVRHVGRLVHVRDARHAAADGRRLLCLRQLVDEQGNGARLGGQRLAAGRGAPGGEQRTVTLQGSRRGHRERTAGRLEVGCEVGVRLLNELGAWHLVELGGVRTGRQVAHSHLSLG